MTAFLIYCIPGSLISMFLAIMIAAGCKTKKDWWVVFITVTSILTILFAGMFALESYASELNWNGGYCECGGEWEFVNASRYRGHTTYYWECNQCKSIIETHCNMR